MFRFRYRVACLFCWALMASIAQLPPVVGQESDVLSVISYNVQFLPPPANIANKRKDPAYRATRIADEVRQFDVIGLQEVFHLTHRAQIIDQITKGWNEKPNPVIAPQPAGFSTNGGTLLLTRRPIVETNSVVFENFSKPADYGFGADGFAAKGVIHGRIAKDPQHLENTIDVYVTHLEARDGQLRPKQYQELAAFIQMTSDPNRPIVLVGDLNTQGQVSFRDDPQSQYSQLLQALQGARPSGRFTDVWVALRGNELGGTSEQESTEIGKRIDYVFVGNPPLPSPQLVPKSIEVKTYQDEKVIALSDHNAVVATFDWKE